MMLESDLEHLACPDCTGEPLSGCGLRTERGRVLEGGLGCARCGATFPVEAGIPVLMPAALVGARRFGIEGFPEEWRSWGERLDAFRAWRERTWSGGGEEERERSGALARRRRDEFARFCGWTRGRALDVGCGDGGLFRSGHLGAAEYWGVDPVPIDGADYDFRFAAALGERLPFRGGTFEAVMVKESLHHFQDPGRFLDEARRVTARGGTLLICQGVEVAAPVPAAPGGRAKVLARRAATAMRLLMKGELAELRRRAVGTPGGDEAPWLWRLTREDIEFEVGRRYAIEEARLDDNCLYLRGRA